MNREALIELGTKAVMEYRQAKGGDAYPPIYYAEEEVTAALTAITEAGMVVMPREPTETMLQAGMTSGCKEETVSYDVSGVVKNLPGISVYPLRVYKAMLAAAERGE